MSVRLSCALPPSAAIVEQAREAERLGYHRVRVFDSPALHGDLWIGLARIAEATERIGLVREVGQVRSLLAGDVVEIDGKPCQMRQLPGFGPARPVRVPVWLAASGPRTAAAAARLEVPGVLGTGWPDRLWPEFALLRFGTVLRPGEDHTTPRVIDAAGPGWAGVVHAIWEGSPVAVDDLPGGRRWRADLEAGRPEPERHLDVHQGHLTTLTDRDRDLATAAGPALLDVGWTGTPDQLRAKAVRAAQAGVTEVVYIPTWPDVTAELAAYAQALIPPQPRPQGTSGDL